MTKRTKKTQEFRSGFYRADVGEKIVIVEVRGGLIASIDDEVVDCPTVEKWLSDNQRAVIGTFLGEDRYADENENTPEAVAAAPEADLETREGNQTTESITGKRVARKPAVRTLRFDLSSDEVEAKCAAISRKSRANAELDAEFARVRADYKGRIERASNEIIAELRAVEDRAEYREVECEEVHDFEARMVRFEFEGSTYEQREMTPSERQMTFEEVF